MSYLRDSLLPTASQRLYGVDLARIAGSRSALSQTQGDFNLALNLRTDSTDSSVLAGFLGVGEATCPLYPS